MKIVKITTEWDNGRQYSISNKDVDKFFNSGIEATKMYLLFVFTVNLSGGLNWKKVK